MNPDVIQTSLWRQNEGQLVIVWYQWKEETHTYPLVLTSYESEALQRKSREGGGNHPPSVDVLQKIAKVNEG